MGTITRLIRALGRHPSAHLAWGVLATFALPCASWAEDEPAAPPDAGAAESADTPPVSAAPAPSLSAAIETEARSFEIAPQSLRSALEAFGEQAGLELTGLGKIPADLDSPGVTGEHTPAEALSLLLADTGVRYSINAAGGVRLAVKRRGVEEIVVTARKRDELIQNVPLAVTAFDVDALKAARARRLADVINLTPNAFSFPQADGQATTTIRGVRSTTFARETGVPVYLDGAYSSIQTASPDLDFFDLCSVQILRGPQGGLYGRNAIGGAMLLESCKPTEELESELSFEAGSFDTRRFDGSLNVPLFEEKLGVRFAGFFNETEGAFRNVFTGDKEDGNDSWGWRASVRWTPVEGLELTAVAEQTDEDLSQSVWSLDGNSRQREVDVNTPGMTLRDRDRYNLSLRWDSPWGIVDSITSYIRLDNYGLADIDRTSVLTSEFDGGAHSTLFTHETRLASDDGGPFSWLVGVQYYRDRFRARDSRILTNRVAMVAGLFFDNLILIDSDRVTENIALFVETRYVFFDRLELAVTLRGTHEERTAESRTEASILFADTDIPVPAGLLGFPPGQTNPRRDRLDDGDSFYRLDPVVSVSYDWTDEIMTYATFTTAYKSGGSNFFTPTVLNFTNPVDEIFDSLFFQKETARGYEIGIKANLFDQRYWVNAAAFRLDQEDLQLLVESQTIATVDNGGDGETYGFEIEMVAEPFLEHDLRLAFGYSYIDAEFSSFEDAPNPDLSGFATEDRSGNKLPFTFKDSVNIAADYAYALNEEYSLRWHLDYIWMHGGFYNSRNTEPLEDHRTVNAKLTLEHDRFELGFYVENLFDSTFFSRPVTDVNDDTLFEIFAGRLNRPREYGVFTTLRF